MCTLLIAAAILLYYALLYHLIIFTKDHKHTQYNRIVTKIIIINFVMQL